MATHGSESKIEIIVSDDGYRAELNIILDPESVPYTLEEADALLNEQKITFGVDRQKLKALCENGKNVYFEPIAIGHLAVLGVDAKIQYFFNETFKAKPQVYEDGSVDFKNMHYIELTQKGDLLAEKTPFILGSDGVNVHGKYQPVKRGRDLPLIAGKNCKLSEDGLKVYADTSGIARIVNGKVEVEETIEIRSDISVETGNIDFTGSVIVYGNLLKGYSINCGGDLILNGYCDGGDIHSGGNITVQNGIQGAQNASITCAGTLTTKYINKAICEVEGDIVTGAIINSAITCDGKIIVKGKKGAIVGGQLLSSQIEANAIGANLGAKTYIQLGAHALSIKNLKQISTKRVEIENKLQKVDQILYLLKQKLTKPTGRVAVKILYDDYLRHRENMIEELETLTIKARSITETLGESNGLLVARTIYPDTIVKIGEIAHNFSEAIMDVKVSKKYEKICIERMN